MNFSFKSFITPFSTLILGIMIGRFMIKLPDTAIAPDASSAQTEQRHVEQSKSFSKLTTDVEEEPNHFFYAGMLPQEKFKKTYEMPLAIDRSMEMNVLFREWGRTNPEDAMERAWNLVNANDSYIAFSAIMEGWSSTDLAGAVAYAKSMYEGPEKKQAMLGLMKNWGKNDPAAAADYLERYGKSNMLSTLGPELLKGWGERSVYEASEWIENMELGATKMQLYAGLAESWAKQDPQAALDFFYAQPGYEEAQAAVFNRWAMDDPQAAGQYLDALPERVAEGHIMDFVHQWSLSDPQGALDWARKIPDQRNREQAISGAMANLEHTNPEHAAKVAEELITTENSMTYLFGEVSQAWAKRDPAKASAWIEELENPINKSNAAGGLIPVWAQSEPQQAANWLLRQDSGLQSELLEVAIEEWGSKDPYAAMEYIKSASVADKEVRFRSMAKAIDQLFLVDPHEAVKEMAQLPDVDYSDDFYKDTAFKWANYNHKAAAEWINNLPDDFPYLDEVIDGFNDFADDGAMTVKITRDY